MNGFYEFIHKNSDYPKNIEFENDTHFSFISTLNCKIYCRFFSQENLEAPVIVLFHGVGAHTNTVGYREIKDFWYSNGFNVVGMDVRNQGGMTIGEPTVSNHGLYASGIFNNFNYFHHIYFDAVALVNVVKRLYPHSPIIAVGGSQGGTLAIISSILNSNVSLVLADMPNCIDIKALIQNSKGGFQIFKSSFFTVHPQYHHVIESLSQIDLMHYVDQMKKPILLSSGNLDEICPLDNLMMFYEKLTCKKNIEVYENFGHGGYDQLHNNKKLSFISENL
jgi:cephalosporin-C deacetylase